MICVINKYMMSVMNTSSDNRPCYPGATATDLWEIAGRPWQQLPPSIIMSPEDMVDAALAGLDAGELVTIPSLHDGDAWLRFEADRRALSTQFGHSAPAPRYHVAVHP